MNKVTVVVKDQEENESIVIAQLNDLEDKDIPFALGKELFETASEPKNFIEYSGDHIKALIINPNVIITKVNENLK